MKLTRRLKLVKSLTDFDLTEKDIAEILREAHAKAADFANTGADVEANRQVHAKSARGLVFYLAIVEGIRRRLLERGWRSKLWNGLELVEHPERKVRLGYCAGDAATGTAKPPASLRRRGPASARIVRANNQLAFNAEWARPTPPEEEYETWLLVVFRGVKEYRAELVLFGELSDGYLSGVTERVGSVSVALKEPLLPAPPPPPPPRLLKLKKRRA